MADDRHGARLKETARWMAQSGHDLADAAFCAQAGRHALACFLSQQAAEKAVAAYLFARGAEEVWGHALADLCEDAKAFDPSFDIIKPAATLLDKHFIQTRYPGALPGGVPSEAYDSLDSERAIEIAGEVVQFVESQIKALGGV